MGFSSFIHVTMYLFIFIVIVFIIRDSKFYVSTWRVFGWEKHLNWWTLIKQFALHIVDVCVCSVASVMSDYLWPYGLWLIRLLCPWDSPGKNTWVGFHFLPQYCGQALSNQVKSWLEENVQLLQARGNSVADSFQIPSEPSAFLGLQLVIQTGAASLAFLCLKLSSPHCKS